MIDRERYDRNIGVWDEAFQAKLAETTVGIAGLGGSGGALAALLARNGFGHLKIADLDTFERHNIQRQRFATEGTLGRAKVTVTRDAIRDINPAIQVTAFAEGVTLDNLDGFLDGCDFVHEVVDLSVPGVKHAIHRRARERGVITTTAIMTAAGVSTLAFHPEGMSFEEWLGRPDFAGDWAATIRRLLGYVPDYLDLEAFSARVRQGTVPSTADAAMLTAVTTAGIYKRALMGKPVAWAPKILKLDLLDDQLYARDLIDTPD